MQFIETFLEGAGNLMDDVASRCVPVLKRIKENSIINVIADKVATATMKHVEISRLPDGTVSLDGFKRFLQLDDYTCGLQSALMILDWHNRGGDYDWARKIIGTNEEGSSISGLKRVFRKARLRTRHIRKPKLMDKLHAAIGRGSPVLISVDWDDDFKGGDHWAVVFGYGPGFILVADPSLARSVSCVHDLDEFKERLCLDVQPLEVYKAPRKSNMIKSKKRKSSHTERKQK